MNRFKIDLVSLKQKVSRILEQKHIIQIIKNMSIV